MAWTVALQNRSHKMFFMLMQRSYYRVGTVLRGMKGDSSEYNPGIGSVAEHKNKGIPRLFLSFGNSLSRSDRSGKIFNDPP